jgi:hypothetical protein
MALSIDFFLIFKSKPPCNMPFQIKKIKNEGHRQSKIKKMAFWGNIYKGRTPSNGKLGKLSDFHKEVYFKKKKKNYG